MKPVIHVGNSAAFNIASRLVISRRRLNFLHGVNARRRALESAGCLDEPDEPTPMISNRKWSLGAKLTLFGAPFSCSIFLSTAATLWVSSARRRRGGGQ